jgi:hypothetical protein
MKKFLIFLVIVVRIYIATNILVLLYLTNLNSDRHPISDLTWWIYFLVFDIWLQLILPKSPDDDKLEE